MINENEDSARFGGTDEAGYASAPAFPGPGKFVPTGLPSSSWRTYHGGVITIKPMNVVTSPGLACHGVTQSMALRSPTTLYRDLEY